MNDWIRIKRNSSFFIGEFQLLDIHIQDAKNRHHSVTTSYTIIHWRNFSP